MSGRLVIAVLVFLPVIAWANLVMIDGQALIAFGIVAFWALVIESGIATLALVSSGLLIVLSFDTIIVVNVACFSSDLCRLPTEFHRGCLSRVLFLLMPCCSSLWHPLHFFRAPNLSVSVGGERWSRLFLGMHPRSSSA